MKRIVLASAIGLLSLSAFGQEAVDKALVDQLRKDKEKSDNSLTDPKNSAKASFWMDRAKTYEDIAEKGSQIDSVAAKTSLEAYKKVVELDLTKKGEPGKLAKDAQLALKGEPGTNLYHAFFKQGAEQYQIKNLNSALELFKTAQGINPKDTLVALYGGITAQQLDKKDEAKALFENYAANGGKDPSVFYGLAQLYRADNNFDKATEVLNKGLEKSPGNKDLKSEIVNILLASGKEDQALKELEAMAQSDPKNVQNLVNLALLYDNLSTKQGKKIKDLEAKTGGDQDKIGAATKAVEDEKAKVEVFDGEIKRITGLIKKQPKNADLKRQLTEVTAKKKDAATALPALEKEVSTLTAAASQNTTDASAVEKELTELKADQKKNIESAEKNYKAVLEIDPANYDALYSLGAVYFNEAVILKGEVDRMNMNDYQSKGKEVEGRVCGKFKKAKPYFEKAVKVKDAAEAKETLEIVNNVLQQFEGKGITCVD